MTAKASGNSLAQIMEVATTIDREIESTGGELSPELERALGLNADLTAQKVDATEYVIKQLDALSDHFKERAAEFMAAAKARSNLSERIRDRVKQLMLTHEKAELAGEYVRFVLSPSIPALVIEDETQIPKEFIKTVVTEKIDNAAVKSALQTGTPVPGAHLTESFSLRSYAATKKRLGGK